MLRVPRSTPTPLARPALGALCLATLLALGPACAAHADAGTPPDPAASDRRTRAIVRAADFTISVGDVEDYIAQQPPALRERYRDAAEQKTLVENLLRLALMSREAERRGFGSALSVRHTVKDGTIQALVRAEVDEKVTPQSVTDAELAAYYAAHPADFHRPAERRASYIKLATHEAAEALLPAAKAADLRRFGELAKEQSIDVETKLRGGDLGYFVAQVGDAGAALGNIDSALRSAVFAEKTIGDTVGAPIALDGGFAIVRYTGERPEVHSDLASAGPSIRNRLWREKRTAAVNALIESVRSREKPEVFADRVDLVKFDDMDQPAGGFAPEPGRPRPAATGKPVAKPAP